MKRSAVLMLSAAIGTFSLSGCVSTTGTQQEISNGGASSIWGSTPDKDAKAPYLPSSLFVGEATNFVGWSCSPAQNLVTAAQSDALRVWSSAGGQQLPQTVVASGSRYENGDLSVWLKGDEATVESARGRLECQAQVQRDSLRRAEKPGVMFYATGNEPGWSMSLANDVPKIDLSLDYGERKASLPYRVSTLDNGAGRVILVSGRSDAPFEARIEAGACFDDMSGTPWPAKVTLTLNGQQYRGCGQGIAP